jgi:hypothetical protein
LLYCKTHLIIIFSFLNGLTWSHAASFHEQVFCKKAYIFSLRSLNYWYSFRCINNMEPLEINNALLRHLTNPAVCVYRNHSKFLVSWCFLPQMNRKQFNILVFCAIQYPAHQVFVNKCKKDIKQLKQIEVNEHSRVCPSGIVEEFLTSTFRIDFFYACLLLL